MTCSGQFRVLCFSRDRQLLETRLQVLARAYDVVGVSSVPQLDRLPEEPAFQLVLLCHTLSSAECCASADLVASRWPLAKLMTMTTGNTGPPCDRADAVILALQGPAVMLHAIDTLIRRSQPQPVALPHKAS